MTMHSLSSIARYLYDKQGTAMITTAYVLAALIGAFIIFVGLRELVSTQAAANGFGIPRAAGQDHPAPWLAVKAARDIAIGLVIILLTIYSTRHLLGGIMLAATLIPLGDGLIVLHSGGPRSAAYGIHWGTAAVMVAISVLLLAS